MATIHEAAASSGGSSCVTASARIEKNLVMTPEADDFIADLARRTNLREGEVIRLALGMLKAAVDAKAEGKHVGIAESPDVLATECVGF